MTYLAQTLIARSWYLSGIVARGAQVPSGDQITDGLFMLNALLDFKQIETDLIPYWTYILMPLVGGQEYFYLPSVCSIETMWVKSRTFQKSRSGGTTTSLTLIRPFTLLIG